MLDMIGCKYAARLGMPRSSVDGLKHPLVSCSPRSMIAPRVGCVLRSSAFEGECATVFDAQLSLTVVYNTPNACYDKRSQLGAQEALPRS